MSTAATYEMDDLAQVNSIFADWAPSPELTPAWFGLVQENGRLEDDPEPTGRPEAPTIFGAYRIEYDELETRYDDNAAPYRRGKLHITTYTEPGARQGLLVQLRQQLRATLDGAPEEPLAFCVDEARVRPAPVRGPWYCQNFIVPFVGGG